MQRLKSKNSKKGFSLAVAMGVGIFLILIASSLMFIAMNSVSNTSTNLNYRQAYLNVKSALDYATSYYSNNVDDYSDIGTEYMTMNDKAGGSTANGATISTDETKLNEAMTYVIAEYIEANDSEPAALSLSGYAKYSDSFGNKTSSVKLKVVYTIGSIGPNRLTTMVVDREFKSGGGGEETITLNVKQPEDMGFQMSYYVWTYSDTANAYSGHTSGEDSYSYNPEVGRLNESTLEDNIVYPNGKWNTRDDDTRGPQAIMADAGDGWYTGNYVIKSGRVPWFNIIFAQKGSILGRDCSNIYNSQTNEMFHLWYLNPNDKNIYFEFLDKHYLAEGHWTHYYTGKRWNGYEGLEDTILVYVKNIKTTVHFRIQDVDSTSIAPTISAPYLTVTGASNFSSESYTAGGATVTGTSMTYEGCGWWSAVVDAGGSMSVGVSANGSSYSAAGISPNSNNEVWLVAKPGSSNMNVHQSEQNSLIDLGVDLNSYVTVHAKVADYTKKAAPVLSYKDESLNSSTERINLLKTVINAKQIEKTNYTSESYAVLEAAMQAALRDLADDDFIRNQVTDPDTISEKIKKADEAYRAHIDAINTAIANLVPGTATPAEIDALQRLVNDGDTAVAEQEASSKYDYEAYIKFTKDDGPYKTAKAALADTSSLVSTRAQELTRDLNDALTELYAGILMKDILKGNIDKARDLVDSESYEASYRDILRLELDETDPESAISVYNGTDVSQAVIDAANDRLEAKITNVINHPYSAGGDTTNLETAMSTASNALDSAVKDPMDGHELSSVEKKNYTDDTYNALKSKYDEIAAMDLSTKSQSQIDALTEELYEKIYAFNVIKPIGTNSELSYNKKIKVFVYPDGFEGDFELSQYIGGAESTTLASSALTDDGLNGYKYIEIDKGVFDGIVINAFNTSGLEKTSGLVDITSVSGNNLVFVIDAEGNIRQTTFTTIYGGFTGGGNTFGQPLSEDGSPDGKLVYAVYENYYYVLRFLTDETKKIIVNSKVTLVGGEERVYAYDFGKLPAGDYVAQISSDIETAEIVNADNIYPKYTEAPSPTEPVTPAAYTSGDYEIDLLADTDASYIYFTDSRWDSIYWGDNTYAYFFDDSENTVGPAWPGMAMTKAKADSSGNMRYKIKPPAGATKVIFNNNNISQQSATKTFKLGCGYSKGTYQGELNHKKTFEVNEYTVATNGGEIEGTVYESEYIHITNNMGWDNLHIWFIDAEGHDSGAGAPGFYLEYEGQNAEGKDVYKIQPPVGAVKFIVGDGTGADGGDKTMSDATVYLGETYYTNDNITWLRASEVVTPPDVPDVPDVPDIPGGGGTTIYPDDGSSPAGGATDVDASNISMAYVGGSKVRVQNRGYYEIYGVGAKTNDYGYPMNDGTYMYGGDRINMNSGGRQGAAKLTPYYDWYEFKLPVSKEGYYNFQLKGMNKDNEGVSNVEVKKAYGDVWVEQVNNNINTGYYRNFNLLTFDPEATQTSKTLTVYFRQTDGWSNVKLAAYGAENAGTMEPTGRLTRGSNSNIIYFDNISKNTPFLTFSADYTYVTADGTTVTESKNFKTSLQGGDYILFDPNASEGYGQWVSFVSDQEMLKRAAKNLMSMYYGRVIISKYTDDGEVESYGDNTYRFSERLKNMFLDYASSTTSNGVTYYQLKDVKSAFPDEADAFARASYINATLVKYTELFDTMSMARMYVAAPLKDSDLSAYHLTNLIHGDGGGFYPEYLSRTNEFRRYSEATSKAVKKRLAQAEQVYLSDSGSASDTDGHVFTIDSAKRALERAMNGLEVESEGSIGICLYDAQKKVANGSKFKLRYKESATAAGYTEVQVTEYNRERYPIYFVKTSDTMKSIYDVQFIEIPLVGAHAGEEVLLGSPRRVMTEDDQWVYVDISTGTPYWSPNSSSDYREITTDLFVEEDDEEPVKYTMKKWKKSDGTESDDYQPMTLLFVYDTTIECSVGNYVIKAGAYYFTNSDTEEVGSVISGGTINLFSSEARSYFTDPENYGEYVENAVTGDSLGWNDSGDFRTGTNTSAGRNVNFEMNSGSLTKYAPYYSYSSTDGLYFRWSSAEPLYATTTVKLYADEYRFAFSGTLDGTKDNTRGTHFYLFSNDSAADEMIVDFFTDVPVKYYDSMGKKHEFVIYEGKYKIEKEDPAQDFIADFYNETYWKSYEHVTYIGRGGSSFSTDGATTGSLTHGAYG